jgi:hypothetical protein
MKPEPLIVKIALMAFINSVTSSEDLPLSCSADPYEPALEFRLLRSLRFHSVACLHSFIN